MNCILAIDIGTTSTKGLVIQPDGEVIFSTSVAYPTSYPQPGYAEQSINQLWDAVKEVTRKSAGQYKDVIAGVSFSCAMHSVLAVDKQGEAISEVIIWADTRSTSLARNLRSSSLATQIYETTGTPIHPMSPLCKLAWLRDHEPILFDSAFKFVSIKEYFWFKITGAWAIDYSLASATGMFDVHHLKWMPEALAWCGVDEEKLSVCVSPYHQAKSSSTALLEELKLMPSTNFVIGGSDGCLANLGSNVMNPGVLSVTIGTSGAVRATSRAYQADTRQRVFNYRLDEDHFVIGGASNNGSVLLSWFSKQILNEKPDAASFVDRAMKVGEGADGLIFLPYVMGERAPFYNPDACGVFFGLAQHHTHAHMMRALLEGICFELRSIAQAVEESAGKANRVMASGGFTGSAEWVQLLADVLNKEVCIQDANNASAMGASIIGFKALRIVYDFSDLAAVKSFFPDAAKAKLYDDYFQLFAELTEGIQDKFEKITALQSKSVE